MIIYIVAMIALFLIARSFMDFENKTQNKQKTNQPKAQENSFSNEHIEEVHNDDFYENLQIETAIVVALMAKLSAADGKVCELEREFIDNSLQDFAEPFPNPNEIYEILQTIFTKEAEKGGGNIEKLAKQYYELTRYAYTKRVKVLQHIINLAYIDKTFSESEEIVFKQISDNFEINKSDYIQLLESFKKFYSEQISQITDMDIDQASIILEISKSSDMKEVKKRYRELVRNFHPDVLQSQGFNDEVIEESTKKLQEVNEAYEVFKKYKATSKK